MHDSATAFRAFVKVAISGMPLVSQARTPAVQAGHVGIQFVVFHLGHPKRLRTARTGAGKGGDWSTCPAPNNPAGLRRSRRVYAKRILPRITERNQPAPRWQARIVAAG